MAPLGFGSPSSESVDATMTMNENPRKRYARGLLPPNRVNNTGARSGCILRGVASQNEGLRLRVLQDQPKGEGGPIKGRFEILDVGDNKHSDSLQELLGATTDAEEVITVIRRAHPGCVSVVNANLLMVEGAS
jgi:hypothetical protein